MKIISILLLLLTSVSAYSSEINKKALEDAYLSDVFSLNFAKVKSINSLNLFKIREFKTAPYSSEVNLFVTDKCTLSPQSYLPFTQKEGWTHCCVEHDIAHWAGGNEEARETADSRLRQCMKNVNGPAEIFYQVVKRFGHPAMLLGDPKGRTSPWGYGWNYYIGHDDLTPDQESSVCHKLEQWTQTDQFQEFHQTYVGMQGEVPIMPICE